MEFKLVLPVRDYGKARYITFHVILCISSLEAAFKEKERYRLIVILANYYKRTTVMRL